jgi:hypothetical protein
MISRLGIELPHRRYIHTVHTLNWFVHTAPISVFDKSWAKNTNADRCEG